MQHNVMDFAFVEWVMIRSTCCSSSRRTKMIGVVYEQTRMLVSFAKFIVVGGVFGVKLKCCSVEYCGLLGKIMMQFFISRVD